MSALIPKNRSNDNLDGPAQYAPRWLREGRSEQASSTPAHLPKAPQLVMPQDSAQGWLEPEPVGREMDHALQSLEPQIVIEPRKLRRQGRFISMVGRLAFVVAAAAAGAAALTELPFGSMTSVPVAGSSDVKSSSGVPQAPTSSADLADGTDNLRASGTNDPSGAGAANDAGIAAANVAAALPDQAFISADANHWGAAANAPAWPPVSQGTPESQPMPAARTLAPEDIDALLRRARLFISQGDISAARAVLQRAAEARDPRAALALGATYDPNELKSMGAVGIKSDTAQARAWYKKAAEYGSTEAPKRIALLP